MFLLLFSGHFNVLSDKPVTNHVPHFLVHPVGCFFGNAGFGGLCNFASGHRTNVCVDQQTNGPFCLSQDCTKMHFLTGTHGTSLFRSLSRFVLLKNVNHHPRGKPPLMFSEKHLWICHLM